MQSIFDVLHVFSMLCVILLILFQLFCKINCITNYCEVCPEHVLCLYTASGPGPKCRGFDMNAKLTRNEIKIIVSKINERRSYVARGMTTNSALPQAANMRTVSWSDELAVFAQRWAAQCDPTLHRDQLDKCRNLPNMAVGQSIASVSGSTPGLNVKSFVDIWFMQSLDYSGSVSYYNNSHDGNTDYFTQLIWADTNKVGCGKVKFYIAGGKIPVARLVCNFAPSGNIYGRPVYTIGFPATQCPAGTGPDTTFRGLCTSTTNTNARLPTTRSMIHSASVSSLLKILNLFNDSVTQEIDPIRIDIKQQRAKANETDDRRNQKTRHIYNRTNNADQQFHVPMMGNLWNPNMNMSRRHDHQMHFDRGHSRIFHEHDFPIDITTLLPPTDNYRRHYQQECTRRGGGCNECTTTSCITNECATTCAKDDCQPNRCTRGQTSPCCELLNPCPQSACSTRDSCAPQCHTTFPTTRCNYGVTCECLPKNPCQQTTVCPNNYRRKNDNSKAPPPPASYPTHSNKDFQYYDLFPNVALRHAVESENTSSKDDTWLVNYHKGFTPKSMLPGRKIENRKKISDIFMNSEKPPDDREYFYDTLYPNPRKKRKVEEDTSFKPFWQVEEYTGKPELKALRYTTLSGMKYFQYSERVKEDDNYDNTPPEESDYEHPVKEKFLSFDELMNLRLSNVNKQLSGRRAGKATTKKKPETKKETKKPAPKKAPPKKVETKKTTTKATTTKPPTTTTTTPTTTETFPRIRHCTRQLTCTWTAPTVIGEGGEPRPAGDSGGRGSRTPPGYVEGCTRTSTCTRDYMQRNKLAPAGDVEGSGTEPPSEDEDYCERRSLNVKRRDCGDLPIARNVFESDTEKSASTVPYSTTTHIYSIKEEPNVVEEQGCVCDEKKAKNKRSVIHLSKSRRHFCYNVLNQIIEMWRERIRSPRHNCLCNKSVASSPYKTLLLLMIMIYIVAFSHHNFFWSVLT